VVVEVGRHAVLGVCGKKGLDTRWMPAGSGQMQWACALIVAQPQQSTHRVDLDQALHTLVRPDRRCHMQRRAAHGIARVQRGSCRYVGPGETPIHGN
jgi:hypothetical protein